MSTPLEADATADATAGTTTPDRWWRHGPAVGLVAVGIAYLVVQLSLLGLHWDLTHDEVVYLSRVNPYTPNLAWTAWRAWGMAVLVAPVAVFDPSNALIRAYTDSLGAVGIVFAFWPWLKSLRGWVAPLAALLFASCWITTYFGDALQPNMWVALAAVAVVGWCVRALVGPRRGRRRAVIGMLVAGFWLALLRPTDSVFVVAPLVVFCLLPGRWRRPALVWPLVVGFALGLLPWVIEGYTTFGSPLHRLQIADSATDPSGTVRIGGFHPNLTTAQLYGHVLQGRYYAYPLAVSRVGHVHSGWLVLVAVTGVLMVLGLYAAARQREFVVVGVATVTGLSTLVFYVFLLNYAAARFLLPVIALLSLPVATALVWLGRARSAPVRAVGAFVGVALIATFVGTEFAKAQHLVDTDKPLRMQPARIAHAMRAAGVRPPCYVLGTVDLGPIGYWSHCTVHGASKATVAKRASQAQQRYANVAVVTGSHVLPAYLADWRKLTVSSPRSRYYIWVSPRAGMSTNGP
jgi:hypothetical protein